MATADDLQKGSYFIHNNEPVRVLRREVVAYGTHSHSKLKIFFQGLNDKGERSINLHHTDKVEIVNITRKTGQVISKAGDTIQVMDADSYESLDATAAKELFNEINEGDEVTFIDLNGVTQIIEKR